MGADQSLISKTAMEMIAMLRKQEITPHDCLDALEARIAAVDGPVNALPTLCFDRARKAADAVMAKPADARGLLAGLPVPIKDLTEVAGVRTTHGSPIFADHVPESSDPLVERIESEDGIVYAKSNTPEFGAGANTFNDVFGATRNPWNTTRSAAGSSGGAAAALASGTAWLAHGSDLGGSLRNPASFCGIVGLRPSPGRVATKAGWPMDRQLPAQGPMARNVEDVALFLDALTGEDVRDPVSLPKPATSFHSAAVSGWRPKRVAFSPGLGITPVDPEVADICRKAAFRFAEAGAIVEETHPDFSEAHDTFNVLRAKGFAIGKKELLETKRSLLKPEVIWNIEKGLALTMADHERAERQRAVLYHRALSFFQTYDLICTPATIVAAFPVEQRYLESCDGVTFDNYVHWLAIAYAFTLVSSPAISIPCGFTREGLPVGLQIAARPRNEAQLLPGAKLMEDILGLKGSTPIEPRIMH
ncbi:MAG: amidase [Rhizobiales bacterium 65-9]|nr:amidase [Hyphomicrobiales bacterium]OJY38157.1 MAG: amidase [Rhizobiales bacterium 65-9]